MAKVERAVKGGHAKHGTGKESCLSVNVSDKQKSDTRAAVSREARVPERKTGSQKILLPT